MANPHPSALSRISRKLETLLDKSAKISAEIKALAVFTVAEDKKTGSQVKKPVAKKPVAKKAATAPKKRTRKAKV